MQNQLIPQSQNRFLEKLYRLEHKIIDTYWSYIVLLLCGLLSAGLTLVAYAPADGADAADYYLHAAYIAGEEVPGGFALHPPLLPIIILFFRYAIGNVYGIIFLQLTLSVLQAAVIYWGVKEYDKRFAFYTALLIAFDMQTKVLSSFVSTEPIYIFLITVAFSVLVRQVQFKSQNWIVPQDLIIPLVLTFLFFTRAVGRYLIIPFLLVFLLFTRSWKRSLVVLVSYLIFLQGFYFIYDSLTTIEGGNLAGINNEVQWSRPLFRGNLLNPENGSASNELFQAASNCRPDVPVRCLVDILGQERTLSLVNQALRETVLSNPVGYGLGVARHFSDFLSFSGQQYLSSSPAQAQCTDINERAERGFQSAVEGEWLASDTSGVDLLLFRDTVYRINGLMCPPWFESQFVRTLVDEISSLYSVFAPPRAYILYGLLLLVAMFWRQSRQYLPIILSSILIISYHAGVSSLIFNVQARYAVVINTYRIILLAAFIYLGGRLIAYLWNLYARRSSD